MRTIEALLASYLDLARHADPLRYPDEAPPEIHHRLGRFDPASALAHAAALKSIVNALEDLEGVDTLDDEVDRTMLINTIRTDILRATGWAESEASNPALPLEHLDAALMSLMGEDFDAEGEAALRERIAAFPDFLTTLREDTRPAPDLLVANAKDAAADFDQGALDMASERLDEAAVQPALVAIAEHRAWLGHPERIGPCYGMGEPDVEARLATMAGQPLGVNGTLRLLELRRAGVERSLRSAADELGTSEPLACVQELLLGSEPDAEVFNDYWSDEWQRVGDEMRILGLPVPAGDPPDPPAVDDGWSMAAWAVRDHAARMLRGTIRTQTRAVRRLLRATGLRDGWGRTVAALLRNTDVFGLPERRVMMSYLALRESTAAEADLLLQSRAASVEELVGRGEAIAGFDQDSSRAMIRDVVTKPLHALAAALSHEAWQSWYAEVGGEPVPFILRALEGGGLAVPLARWSIDASRANDLEQPS